VDSFNFLLISPIGDRVTFSKKTLIITLALLFEAITTLQVCGDELDAGVYLGLEYYLNDSSVYPSKIYESDYPSLILPLRGALGGYGSMKLSESWRLGGRIQLTSLSGDGVLPNGGRVYLSSFSLPVIMYAAFGNSPYIAGSIGYSFGFSSGASTNIGESSGFIEGLRLGWEGFYLSADAIVSGQSPKAPEYRIGIGYENFVQLIDGLKTQVLGTLNQ